jgi:Uma2 family endonuclease
MSVLIAEKKLPVYGKLRQKIEEPLPRYITWQEFQRQYLSREDRFKYEWVDGIIEKTERTMDQKQYFILKNLRQLFTKLLVAGHITGGFEAEIDTFFLAKIHRRPDIAYFSEEQEAKMALEGNQVPEFVIEIISTHDQMNRSVKKMKNYRDAGVKVVWHIYPEQEEVHVYSGDNLDTMLVCMGARICSAAPVLINFALTANDVFKMPKK